MSFNFEVRNPVHCKTLFKLLLSFKSTFWKSRNPQDNDILYSIFFMKITLKFSKYVWKYFFPDIKAPCRLWISPTLDYKMALCLNHYHLEKFGRPLFVWRPQIKIKASWKWTLVLHSVHQSVQQFSTLFCPCM